MKVEEARKIKEKFLSGSVDVSEFIEKIAKAAHRGDTTIEFDKITNRQAQKLKLDGYEIDTKLKFISGW